MNELDIKKIGNRIKSLRTELNLTQEELANKLVSVKGKSSIANYENGNNLPSDEVKLKMCKIFNCSLDYLMCKTDVRNNNIDNNEKQFYMCPVYGQISAGQPNWAEECIEGRLPLDPNLMGIINPEEHYFLRVNGESMNKIVKNGSFALIHKQDTVENGEIAVVLVNGYNATLKKFTKQGDLIILEPQSDDESFETQVYDKTTPIQIIGKYVGKMEINK